MKDKQKLLKKLIAFDTDIALIVGDLWNERDEYKHMAETYLAGYREQMDQANHWRRMYVAKCEEQDNPS